MGIQDKNSKVGLQNNTFFSKSFFYRNTKRIIEEEAGNKMEWTQAMNLIDEDLSKLSRYFKADEVKIKDLTLKLVKLREKVKTAREELKNASTRSKMAQLALDKSAEEFRDAHKERHRVATKYFKDFDECSVNSLI